MVLVPDAKPGENVEVKITKLFGRVAFGKIVRR
ncbi:MAG: TRAM domain-containing protein [Candidatus Zixiibacteriota bacterium]